MHNIKESLIVLERLGRGTTSHVFKVQSIRDKKLYAMKVIDKKAKNYNHSGLKR
jgi:serine/threonine protein kinase